MADVPADASADDVARLQDLVAEVRAAGRLLRDLEDAETETAAKASSRSPSRDRRTSSAPQSPEARPSDHKTAGDADARTLAQVLSDDRDRWMHRAKGLAARVELLLHERAQMSDAASRATEDCTVVANELRITSERLAALEREHRDSASIIADLRGEASTTARKLRASEEAQATLDVAVRERDTTVARLQARVEEQDRDLELLRRERATLQQTNASLQSTLAHVPQLPPPDPRLVSRYELDVAVQRAESAEDAVGVLEAKLLVAETRAEAAEKRAARKAKRAPAQSTLTLERRLAATESQLAAARDGRATAADAEVQASPSDVDEDEVDGDDAAAAMESSAHEPLGLCTRLDRELEQARLQVSALTRALEESVARECELEAQVGELEAAAASAPSLSPARVRSSISTPLRTPLRAGGSPEREPRALGEMRKAVQAWRDAANKSQAQLQQERAEHEACAARLRDCQQKLLATEQRCGTFQDQAKRASADKSAHQELIAKLRANVDALTAEVSEVKGVNAQLQRDAAAAEHVALHCIEGAGTIHHDRVEACTEVLQWHVAARRCCSLLDSVVPGAAAARLAGSLEPAPSESAPSANATDELSMQLMHACVAAARQVSDRNAMCAALEGEVAHQRDEIALWHALFPPAERAEGEGEDAAATEDREAATALERAEGCVNDRERLVQQLAREQSLRHSLADRLGSTEAELAAAQERLAAIAPQQHEFFAKQRPMLLRHLYQTVRALRPAKTVLERLSSRASHTPAPQGGSPSATPMLAHSAAGDAEAEHEEALAAVQTIAAIRRRADWLLMKCFTAHERSEVDTADLSLLASGFDGDDMSSIARSPSVMTRQSNANDSALSGPRPYRA